MSDIVNGHVEDARSNKKDVWVMYSITVASRANDEEKRETFVNPIIYITNNIGKEDPHFELTFENRSDIEDLTKNSRYNNAKNSAEVTVRLKSETLVDVRRIADYLRRIHQAASLQELNAILREGGLNQSEIYHVMTYRDNNRELMGLYLKIGLQFNLNKDNELDSIFLWFMDRIDRRISSIKTIYPFNNYVFGRMKVGPKAGHKPTDETVVRDIHCRHCSRKIATGTMDELASANQLVDICDACQEVENMINLLNPGKDPQIERVYKISGRSSVVNNLEVLFREISTLSSVGASREIKLYIDGDGIVDIDIKRMDNMPLNDNCNKSGYLKRERKLGEGDETGYLTYLDLG